VTPPSAVPFVISYFTDDLAANRRFYGDVLGLRLDSELPETYFLCGTESVRLQILVVDPDRPGRREPSSGLVLVGVDSAAHQQEIAARAAAAGVASVDGGLVDPDGRIVIVRTVDPVRRFHD
jgi:catechol 2,3-dioxygenase-like lactoylglutathione lyase family enzyme